MTWFVGRFILVASRSVNTVVWGLLFVAIFGPGPLAGIWAIAFRSIGFMGKLVAEAIEEIDAGTVEAIEATGASRLQVLWNQYPRILRSRFRWRRWNRHPALLFNQPVFVAGSDGDPDSRIWRGHCQRIYIGHRSPAHNLRAFQKK
jgi:hypothetical protein